MKILKQLKAVAAEGDFRDPRGILQTVHLEPVTGFFIRATLGGAGLVIRTKNAAVAIPLSELLALAQQHEAALLPPQLVTEAATAPQPAKKKRAVAGEEKSPTA